MRGLSKFTLFLVLLTSPLLGMWGDKKYPLFTAGLGWRGVLLALNDRDEPETITLIISLPLPMVVIGGQTFYPTPLKDNYGRYTGYSEIDVDIAPLGYKRIQITDEWEDSFWSRGWLLVTAKAASQYRDVNVRTAFFYEYRKRETGEVSESVAIQDHNSPQVASYWRAMPVEMIELRDTALGVTRACELDLDTIMQGDDFGCPIGGGPTDVNLHLYDAAGNLVGMETHTFYPGEAVYVSELFPEIKRPFRGQLRVRANDGIYVTCIFFEWRSQGGFEVTSIPSAYSEVSY